MDDKLMLEWEKYQKECHVEDRMSYVEFLSEKGIYI
jgi:hypothetical protein